MDVKSRKYTVLISSSGDLLDERNRLDDVVRDIGALFDGHGLQPVVWRYERNATPGIGEDAQFVVNKDLPDDYDLFVGIMRRRLGTRTARAASGTVEEFNAARDRFLRTGIPKVFFYFSTEIDSLDYDSCDEQTQAVLEFRAAFPGLYETYEDADNLVEIFSRHLTSALLSEIPGSAQGSVQPPSKRLWAGRIARYLESRVPVESFRKFGVPHVQRALSRLYEMFDLGYTLDQQAQDLLIAAAYAVELLRPSSEVKLEKYPLVGDLHEEVLLTAWPIAKSILSQESNSACGPAMGAPQGEHKNIALIKTLLEIAQLIVLDRAEVASASLQAMPGHRNDLPDWLCILTDRITIGRNGLITFHLRVPEASWIAPLKGATAYKLEGLVQRHRRQLSLCGLTMTIAPCQVRIDPDMETIPEEVLVSLVNMSKNTLQELEYLPHLGSEDLSHAKHSIGNASGRSAETPPFLVDCLLPVPDSAVIDSLKVGLGVESVNRMHVVDIVDFDQRPVITQEVPPNSKGTLELNVSALPSGQWYQWRVSWDDGTGLGYAQLASSRVRRLDARERTQLEIIQGKTAAEQLAVQLRVGLKSNLLEVLWTGCLDADTPIEWLFMLYRVLHDATRCVEEQTPNSARLERYRQATNWARSKIQMDNCN